MSMTLFLANIKNNRFIWLLMTFVFCFYLATIIAMFDPAGADAMNEMLDLLPEAMVKALSFDKLGTELTTFISGYIYGFLILMFPLVISIVINHRLFASHIDRGSMAYLLATPNSRIKLAVTQALFSLFSITVFFIIITLFGIMFSAFMFPGKLEVSNFIMLNLYALLMYYSIGGIGFFASAIATDSKTSLSIGVGVPVTFVLLQMLGNASDKIDWIGKLSLYALFDADKLFAGDAFATFGMIAFAIIATVLYGLGIYWFNKRDLHV